MGVCCLHSQPLRRGGRRIRAQAHPWLHVCSQPSWAVTPQASCCRDTVLWYPVSELAWEAAFYSIMSGVDVSQAPKGFSV